MMSELEGPQHQSNDSIIHSQQDFFYECWILYNCETCLSSQYPCSWCATSQVCVPNDRFQYPFALLAPIKYDNICPLGWRERWEMRAKPFSCRCSSMTLVSVMVAVVSTLVGVFLIWLSVKILKRLRRAWKSNKANRARTWISGASGSGVLIWFGRRPENADAAVADEETSPLLVHS